MGDYRRRMSPYVGYQETLVHLPCNESKCLAFTLGPWQAWHFQNDCRVLMECSRPYEGFAFTRWAISKVYPGLTKLRISGSTLHVHGNKCWSRGSEATPIGEDGYSSLEGRF